MAEVDQISLMLGSISSDIKTLFNSHTQHRIDSAAQMDGMRKEMQGEFQKVYATIAEGDKPGKETAVDYNKNKFKIIGAGIAVSSMSGFFGAKWQIIFDKITGIFFK